MTTHSTQCEIALNLLRRMIAVDSRSFISNLKIAKLIENELSDWELELIDYIDASGVNKRNIVAYYPGSKSNIAFAGHLDTVPDTGWTRNPFAPTVEGAKIYGLGASDMKGSIAAFITAAKSVSPVAKPVLIFTADEEEGKQGVREVVARSKMLNRSHRPQCFIVGEPTDLEIVRGHRVDIQFTARATGVQAHSSTGKGRNANIALIPFLADIRALHLRLRGDVNLHDLQYDPPFCDLNFVIDNYGTFPNTTVGLATCKAKFRYSKSIDPTFVLDAVRQSAATHDIDLSIKMEAPPPELNCEHQLVKSARSILNCNVKVSGLGTEASEYSKLAPCLVFGPGHIECAHKPSEYIDLPQFYEAIHLFRNLALNLKY